MTGMEHLNRLQMQEAADHDKAVRTLSNRTLIAAAKDLSNRPPAYNRKDPEQRWTMARKAALRREIQRRHLTEADA